jgi:hypothetical protein
VGITILPGGEGFHRLHPVFKARLEALARDPAMKNQVAVRSAVRTKAEQEFLFDLFLHHGGNLAADPNRVIEPAAYGLPRATGSWHMVQGEFGYAVDIETEAMTADVLAVFPAVAAKYRLQQTVLHKGRQLPSSPPPPAACTVSPAADVLENWHLQCPLDEGPLTWIPEEDVMNPEQERKLDKLISLQEKLVDQQKKLLDQLTKTATRTDLILDHVEGRTPKATGSEANRPIALRRVLGAITDKVDAVGKKVDAVAKKVDGSS